MIAFSTAAPPPRVVAGEERAGGENVDVFELRTGAPSPLRGAPRKKLKTRTRDVRACLFGYLKPRIRLTVCPLPPSSPNTALIRYTALQYSGAVYSISAVFVQASQCFHARPHSIRLYIFMRVLSFQNGKTFHFMAFKLFIVSGSDSFSFF